MPLTHLIRLPSIQRHWHELKIADPVFKLRVTARKLLFVHGVRFAALLGIGGGSPERAKAYEEKPWDDKKVSEKYWNSKGEEVETEEEAFD